MTENCSPNKITEATTIDPDENIFFIDASTSFDITIPTVTCDGIKFGFVREDHTSNTVRILTQSSNLIYSTEEISKSSFIIKANSTVEIISYSGNWYISEDFNTITNSGGSIITTAFVSNNRRPYLYIKGDDDIIVMRFMNTVSSVPRIASVCITPIHGTISGDFVIIGQIDDDVIASINIPNISESDEDYLVFSTTVFLSPLQLKNYVKWIPKEESDDKNKMGLNSFRIA